MLNSVGAIYDYNRARKNEHAANKFSTTLGLGALASTAYLVKEVSKTKPSLARRAEYYTGKYIEKTAQYCKDALKSTTGKKITNCITSVNNKLKSSALAQKIAKTAREIVNKLSSNKTVSNVISKVSKKLQNFPNMSKLSKGRIVLKTAGVALLAYAGFKTITNYYKKEGAIDQKYKDMEVMNKLLFV